MGQWLNHKKERREAAEKALIWFIDMQNMFNEVKSIDIDAYIDKRYPLPKTPKP